MHLPIRQLKPWPRVVILLHCCVPWLGRCRQQHYDILGRFYLLLQGQDIAAKALYGQLSFRAQESEPAFAFFRLIQSSASAVAYVYGNFLSVPWLVIILFPSLLLGQLFVYFLHQYVAAVDAPLQMQPAA